MTKFSAITKINIPSSIWSLISKGLKIEKIFRKLTKNLRKATLKGQVDFKHVILKAPIVNPPKIICLGLNYKDHAEENGSPIPRGTHNFYEASNCNNRSGRAYNQPGFIQQLDYEIELAIIIGKKGKSISISEAKKYIFRYTILNNVSARDIQFKDGQWTRSKSFDT